MNVLIDNTTFAGTIRVVQPNLKEHEQFYKKYPSFREIDVHSFCDFLTAIVLYNKIQIDAHSKIIEKLKEEKQVSWVDEVKDYLPDNVSALLDYTNPLPRFPIESPGSAINHLENDSFVKAYDLVASPVDRELLFPDSYQIPEIYYDREYVYYYHFDRINFINDDLLSHSDLVKAMFLHRGLFLLSIANSNNCTYFPYYYRGEMLSKISPSIIEAPPKEGVLSARLPRKYETTKHTKEYFNQLNSFYYELLSLSTYSTPDIRFPFIGKAIYDIHNGDAGRCLDLALWLRQDGGLNKTWSELNQNIKDLKKPQADEIIDDISTQLRYASRSDGVKMDKIPNALSLVYPLIQHGKTIEAIVNILPKNVRNWAEKFSNQFIANTPMQYLLITHINTVRGRYDN
ncbi:MAG: hypothetical protein M3O71_30050 [Bacteroidota bacterium]|nr:hypothetical protein [Bacteroidota bacterium]